MRRDRASESQRLAVRQRARNCCEYCHLPERYAADPFSVDHIQPRRAGGKTASDNLALSCLGCNHYKHAKTEAMDPATGIVVPLFHPRLQRWTDHFVWSGDLVRVLGRTPTGRATVDALRLNREGLVNIRRALVAVAAHPPDLGEDGQR